MKGSDVTGNRLTVRRYTQDESRLRKTEVGGPLYISLVCTSLPSCVYLIIKFIEDGIDKIYAYERGGNQTNSSYL